jgi:hypothetical protein
MSIDKNATNRNLLVRNPLVGKSNEKNVVKCIPLNKNTLIKTSFNNIAANNNLDKNREKKISSDKNTLNRATVINNMLNEKPFTKKVVNEKSDNRNAKNFILMNKNAIKNMSNKKSIDKNVMNNSSEIKKNNQPELGNPKFNQ